MSTESEALRETLADFARWLGQPTSVAEWSATRYIDETTPTPAAPSRRAEVNGAGE